MTVKQAKIVFDNNRLMVSGDLDFVNVMQVWQTSLPLLQKCSEFHFDFSGVNSSKSAGLALLVEWIKLAKRMNKKIQFDHLPKELMSVADVCGMRPFLS
jgi:phospholipid transport system transporter-binding protein